MRIRHVQSPDEIVLEEIVDFVRRVGAHDGIGLEDEDVYGWCEIFPQPGAREVDIYIVARGHVEFGGDDANFDPSILQCLLPGG